MLFRLPSWCRGVCCWGTAIPSASFFFRNIARVPGRGISVVQKRKGGKFAFRGNARKPYQQIDAAHSDCRKSRRRLSMGDRSGVIRRRAANGVAWPLPLMLASPQKQEKVYLPESIMDPFCCRSGKGNLMLPKRALELVSKGVGGVFSLFFELSPPGKYFHLSPDFGGGGGEHRYRGNK